MTFSSDSTKENCMNFSNQKDFTFSSKVTNKRLLSAHQIQNKLHEKRRKGEVLMEKFQEA